MKSKITLSISFVIFFQHDATMTLALITGATGFIGKELVYFLLNQGIAVRILTRQHTNIFPKDVEQHIGDLTIIESLTGSNTNVDIVFHLAGLAHITDKNFKNYYNTNYCGTINIMQESINANVNTFIYFSSIKAAGESESCIDENWNILPSHDYGKSKKLAEDYILSEEKNNMHVCILRLPIVYGKNIKGNLYKLLHYVDKNHLLKLPAINNRLSLVSTHDVCRAAWLVANNKKSHKKKYFINDNSVYSTDVICELFYHGLSKTYYRITIPFIILKIFSIFNSNKYKKIFDSSECSAKCIQLELGYSPQYTLKDFLPEIILSYQLGKKNHE